MSRWRYGNFTLSWYSIERGLVWHDNPIYCAASVFVHEDKFYINTTSWFGLPGDALNSLIFYMENHEKQPKFNTF